VISVFSLLDQSPLFINEQLFNQTQPEHHIRVFQFYSSIIYPLQLILITAFLLNDLQKMNTFSMQITFVFCAYQKLKFQKTFLVETGLLNGKSSGKCITKGLLGRPSYSNTTKMILPCCLSS